MAGFQRALSRPTTSHRPTREIFFSVVVPFRNEEENAHRLIDSLKAQHYSNFEVILVDDHSTDHSVEAFVFETKGDHRFRIIHAQREGKKNALTDGIVAARGEVIVTSDADCVQGAKWLRLINAAFDDRHTQMVFGFVRITSFDSMFQRLQALEFSSVVATGVSLFGLGSPVYCNAANLAFRRSAFIAVGGYEGNLHIPSGDDEFLLKKISARFPDGIRFLSDREAFVDTTGASDWRQFLQQRLRWAGKWSKSDGVVSKLMAVFVLLAQLAVIASVAYIIHSETSPAVLKYLLGAKIIGEFVFLFMVCQYQQTKLRLPDFLMVQILYPFYVIYVGIFCNFLPYNWKGRTVKVKGAVASAE